MSEFKNGNSNPKRFKGSLLLIRGIWNKKTKRIIIALKYNVFLRVFFFFLSSVSYIFNFFIIKLWIRKLKDMRFYRTYQSWICVYSLVSKHTMLFKFLQKTNRYFKKCLFQLGHYEFWILLLFLHNYLLALFVF